MLAGRPMPEVVRDLDRVRGEHERLWTLHARTPLGAEDLATLAALDDEILRFDAMCTRVPPFRLHATGIMPGDELTHPASTATARTTILSRVEFEGETMTLMEATCRIAAGRTGRGPALGEWTARGIRVGDAMGLWPTGDPAQQTGDDVGTGTTETAPQDATASASEPPAPPARPTNLEFAF